MLTERYADAILGVISCFDRMLIQGTLPDIARARAMTRHLNSQKIQIFAFTKGSGKTFIKPDSGRCLHYYFYFIDPELGLSHLRVPTWAPFRLRFCLNGHNWLAARLKRHGVGYKLIDNAFVDIDDFERAQELADGMRAKTLHRKLDQYARLFCPVVSEFAAGYHWSLNQVEYATDIVFKRPEHLAPVYDSLVRTAVHAVRAEQVATFLGRKLDPRYTGEVGNDFNTRIHGTRIRHQMGRTAIKMYDKFGRVLRIEAVTNDVSFFRHHRIVEHRDGTSEMCLAPVKKTIHSIGVPRELLGAANRRYLGSVPPPGAAEPYADVLPPGIEGASYTQWEVFFARNFEKRLSIYQVSDEYVPD